MRVPKVPDLPLLRVALRWFVLPTMVALSFPRSTAAQAKLPSTAATQIPAPPRVDDPMLAPVPPPKRIIASWEEALASVRALSTDLKIRYDEVTRAEAQQRVALAGTLPTIYGVGVATHNFITGPNPAGNALTTSPTSPSSPTRDSLAGYLQATQPLLALRPWHGIGTAKRVREAAELSVADLKRTITLSVANALVGVVTAERIAELNRFGVRSALERLDLTQKRRSFGGATGLDVARARQDVETARATLITGDEVLRQAREALGLALGIPEQVGVDPDISIDGLERDALRACKVVPSVDERADIHSARKRMEVAERNIRDVWLQLAPTLSVQSTLATTTDGSGPAANTTWNIQGVLSVPIWDGGAVYGSLRDTRAQRDEAQQNLEALRRQAIIQVEQARRSVFVAEDSRNVAANARALAAETDGLTRSAFLGGKGTSLELVVAASALRQAEIALALREFDVVRARVAALLTLASCP